MDCLVQTLRYEGFRGLYKGATPPLVGWMFMDSIMLGSLTFYRKLLHQNLFRPERVIVPPPNSARWVMLPPPTEPGKLPTLGHGLAGIMAGATVSFIAAPVEHIK